jgi:hypothetical protein
MTLSTFSKRTSSLTRHLVSRHGLSDCGTPYQFHFFQCHGYTGKSRRANGPVVAFSKAMATRNELNPMHHRERDCLCGS